MAFIYGAQTVALVLVSDERLGTRARGYGYLLGALGAGGVIAAPLVNRLASGRRLAPTLLTGIGLAALPMAALCLVHSPVVAAALMVVSGAGATAVDVLTVTLLQRALPDELRGRVFGLLDSGIVLAILAGSVIVSPLVSLLGLSGMLISLGLGVSALAVVGVHRTVQLDRAGAAELDALTPIVELLSSLPILELATRPAIEQLAQAATIEEVDAGRVVVAQGDPADDLYAVFSGDLEVDKVAPDGSPADGWRPWERGATSARSASFTRCPAPRRSRPSRRAARSGARRGVPGCALVVARGVGPCPRRARPLASGANPSSA